MSGYQVALHPRTSQVSWRPISQWDCDRVLVSRTVPLPVNQPLTVRVFLCDTVCEIFISDRASLTTRLYRHRTGQFGLEFRDGPGTVAHLRWHPLHDH